jgi:hypothetical protein
MKLERNGHLNTRNMFPKEFFFSNPIIFLSILDELKNLGFGGTRRIHEIEGARAMDSL